MAKILTPISYSEEADILIQNYDLNTIDVNIWNTEELFGLRIEIRNYYRKEQNAICSFCRQPVSSVYASNCHIEHIAPKSLYPQFIFEPRNLCVICADCNQIKRNQETIRETPDTIKNTYKTKYPDKSEDFHIVHPHYDDYDKHIQVINGYYIDKDSKKGNFTIGACRLNRKLSIIGWEPEVVEEEELMNDFETYKEEVNPIRKGKILENIKQKLFF